MAEGITHFRTPLLDGVWHIVELPTRENLRHGCARSSWSTCPAVAARFRSFPDYLVRRDGNVLTFRNGFGHTFEFFDVDPMS